MAFPRARVLLPEEREPGVQIESEIHIRGNFCESVPEIETISQNGYKNTTCDTHLKIRELLQFARVMQLKIARPAICNSIEFLKYRLFPNTYNTFE